jgi:DNA-directed RNA polymerase specialized sigma24 family protein
MSARVKLPPPLDKLLRSQMETAIREANLGNDDTDIAKRYLIDQIPQIEIAAEFGWERSTISRRISRILLKVENAADKLKYF